MMDSRWAKAGEKDLCWEAIPKLKEPWQDPDLGRGSGAGEKGTMSKEVKSTRLDD